MRRHRVVPPSPSIFIPELAEPFMITTLVVFGPPSEPHRRSDESRIGLKSRLRFFQSPMAGYALKCTVDKQCLQPTSPDGVHPTPCVHNMPVSARQLYHPVPPRDCRPIVPAQSRRLGWCYWMHGVTMRSVTVRSPSFHSTPCRTLQMVALPPGWRT